MFSSTFEFNFSNSLNIQTNFIDQLNSDRNLLKFLKAAKGHCLETPQPFQQESILEYKLDQFLDQSK